ncbi:MAG: hypothetical protein HY319_07265 [Armatimonadetes bacterium]|nr:hypothetical protein [Armatimonadota bacterium]
MRGAGGWISCLLAATAAGGFLGAWWSGGADAFRIVTAGATAFIICLPMTVAVETCAGLRNQPRNASVDGLVDGMLLSSILRVAVLSLPVLAIVTWIAWTPFGHLALPYAGLCFAHEILLVLAAQLFVLVAMMGPKQYLLVMPVLSLLLVLMMMANLPPLLGTVLFGASLGLVSGVLRRALIRHLSC